MAAAPKPKQPPSCALQRTLRKGPARNRTCRQILYVLSVQRYAKDAHFGVFFPGSVDCSESLFDATLCDGDCKIRVSVDPRLNKLIFANQLRSGSAVNNAEFLLEEDAEEGGRDVLLVGLEVDLSLGNDAALRALSGVNVRSLPWFGGEPNLLPLRARRSTYLPLWNDYDFTGDAWRDRPPESGGDRSRGSRSAVSLRDVRECFLNERPRRPGYLRVKILHKSRLMHYGKVEQNLTCPYKAELLVADASASVCVVLWNTLCLEWYRYLQPGMVVRLNRFKVRESYSHRTGRSTQPDIEISLNSSHPCAVISVISSVPPEWCLPVVPHNFLSRKELMDCPHGTVCDVVGLVLFVGRPERIRNKDGKMDQYRWIRLEDGTSDQPIMVKLFSTSQPEVQSGIHPMAVFVCTRVQLKKESPPFQYLTNTHQTQVYCTGTGCSLVTPFKGIRPFKQFLQWLRQADERDKLNRSVIGGQFVYPPAPASLRAFMDEKRGQPCLSSGEELKLLCERLQYRETQSFCIQCTVTAVHYHQGEGREPGPFSTTSPRSPITPLKVRSPKALKRTNPITSASPRKRLRFPSSGPDDSIENDSSLFEGALEFLLGEEVDIDEDEEEDDDAASFVTAHTNPHCTSFGLSCVGMETVPRQFLYQRRHVQANAVGLQPNSFHKVLPYEELETFSHARFYKGHYLLELKVLSDGLLINTLFLPASPGNDHWMPLSLIHGNTWESILSHGGFSPEAPPPSPADLMATKAQLTNQKLVCILDVCVLDGSRVELVLSRAFPLRE
ncbi:RPA-related protein RADX [Denticeps clupeoides]|uniref:RPA-related protein RADX-like n=1 Tax=Denticeps clupeoides TaxID=299321 RepID=A0AAY4A5B9_9TELE|nr:RPA-related protein RADX-like [Denticeps clupeoides]